MLFSWKWFLSCPTSWEPRGRVCYYSHIISHNQMVFLWERCINTVNSLPHCWHFKYTDCFIKWNFPLMAGKPKTSRVPVWLYSTPGKQMADHLPPAISMRTEFIRLNKVQKKKTRGEQIENKNFFISHYMQTQCIRKFSLLITSITAITTKF